MTAEDRQLANPVRWHVLDLIPGERFKVSSEPGAEVFRTEALGALDQEGNPRKVFLGQDGRVLTSWAVMEHNNGSAFVISLGTGDTLAQRQVGYPSRGEVDFEH